MKVYFSRQPNKFEPVGNGAFLYHWDIGSYINHINEEEEEINWYANEITIYPPFTLEKIKEAIITEVFPSNYEKKLINDYNESVIGIGKDLENKKNQYIKFLYERDRLKSLIDADFLELQKLI